MKTFPLVLGTLAALSSAFAQQQQQPNNQNNADRTTQTLTMLDASGSTLTATVTLVGDSSTTNIRSPATTSPSPTVATAPSMTTQPARTESVWVPSTSETSSSSTDNIDVEGGASGSSSGGFSLSREGMIAVIVVVVCVAVFGVLSITLFILAKKRQWKVRESIKRASRRLTGRPVGPRPRSAVDRRKRSGVVAGAEKQQGRSGAPPRKEGARFEERELRDLEKGREGEGDGWKGAMRGNGWR